MASKEQADDDRKAVEPSSGDATNAASDSLANRGRRCSSLKRWVESMAAAKKANQEEKRDAPVGDKHSDDDDDRDESEDEDDWEDSDGETWPSSESRYAPVGDGESAVSGSSSRLAREFTMGAGFHHLTDQGRRAMSSLPRGTVLPQIDDRSGRRNYTQGALELMSARGIAEEEEEGGRGGGGGGGGLRVSKASYVDKILLVTDAPHVIRVYAGEEDGAPCVFGLALVRDGVVFTSGILSGRPLTLQLDEKEPLLDSIELQSCTWVEEGNRVEKRMSYLRLSCASDTLVFGKAHSAGFDGANGLYSEVETATGKLLLSGIGYFDNKPITLQVVDLGSDCEDASDAMSTCVYYDHGVISTNCIRSRQHEVEFKESIATEDDKVWDVLLDCMDAVENSSPSYGELLPNAVNLLERSLGGDINTTHAIFRLDRFLTYTIQEKKSLKTFQNDHLNFYAKLIPMKQMWGIFANTVERIKRINSQQPDLNTFSFAFLNGSDSSKLQALFVFLTQALLLILTLMHIWRESDVNVLSSLSPLRVLVSVCATLVVSFMVKQKMENFADFTNIFPEYRGTSLYFLDGLSTNVGGMLVVLSTFTLLMNTSDDMDLVLNATALLFVLELEEAMVDSSPVTITAMYRAYFTREILNGLQQSDKRYWDPMYLRKKRGAHYRIHLPSCSFYFAE